MTDVKTIVDKIGVFCSQDVTCWDQHGRLVQMHLEQDCCGANPLVEWDGMGTVYSLHKGRMEGYLEPYNDGSNEPFIGYRFGTLGIGWIPLSLSRGMNEEWRTCDMDYIAEEHPDNRWGVVDGIWDATDKDVQDNLMMQLQHLVGEENPSEALWREQTLAYCEGVLESYNMFLSGDVYGYNVCVYLPGAAKPVLEDSCYGFYGEDSVREALVDVAHAFGIKELVKI